MPGRPRDPVQTRARILAAARLRFAGHGFDRTTIRGVAGDAGVDPALVMHYFGNKHGLFDAASELRLDLPDLTGVPPDEVADVLLPLFIAAWSPGGPFLGLLRGASTSPAAAAALVEVFATQVAPALAAVSVDRAPERAALVGAQLLGIAVGRFILELPPLVALTDGELTAWLRPVLAHYLADHVAVP